MSELRWNYCGSVHSTYMYTVQEYTQSIVIRSAVHVHSDQLFMYVGHCTMVSPTSPLACAPAGELRSPQARYFKPAFKAKNHLSWRLGSWNVRSLLDTEGPVETARQGRDTVDGEDRRIDLVIRELVRYNIKVAALQETKWMGNGVYQVGSSTVLASGGPVPGPGEPLQRGEGVAIVLCGPAVGAWQEAGET